MNITYTARWILPVSQPPLARGTITISNNTIESVNPHGERTADVDLGNAAVIPGLVNAHTHLDLSGARGLIPPTDPQHFTDWLLGVIAYRRSRSPEQVQQDIRDGLAECLKNGTTLIGDIAAAGASWDALYSSPNRSVVFYELIGLSKERQVEALWTHLHWLPPKQSRFCGSAISPHAPYSAGKTIVNSFPFPSAKAIHIAESPAEEELLRQRTGPFVPFLRKLGVFDSAEFASSWQSCIDASSIEQQIEFFKQNVHAVSENDLSNAFDKPLLLIHCNYLPLNTNFYRNNHVVFCPRTHAAFGHPPHPFPHFLARGVNVALGTDSLASNPDLDLLAEARAVRENYPAVPTEAILRMATLNGAKTLGFASDCGTLEPGKSADFVVLSLANNEGDPHDLAFASQGPRRTLYRGEWRQ